MSSAGGFGAGASTGGSVATGGSGAVASGGAAGAGGSTATGGVGGTSGGTGASGGTGGTGGTTATGGTGGTGGTSATGGTGGTTATGGTGGSGGGAKGDCCTETLNVSGCSTATVESCVCAQDPYCCGSEWDAICAGETLLYGCGTCPTPTDCCSAGKCSSDAVRECVGDTDSSCGTTSWSATCASEVTSLGCGTCGGTTTPAVWINEIHYDNTGGDTGEGVEIAGTAGTDVTGWTLVFYNGSASPPVKYMIKTLSGSIPNQLNGFGTMWVAAAAIQNGGADNSPEPDGVALADKNGKVVQFSSYEGSFTAADGAASGVQSVDIGKSETSTSPVGQSLGLTGTGKKYSDFTWSGPATATPGQPNGGQSFN